MSSKDVDRLAEWLEEIVHRVLLGPSRHAGFSALGYYSADERQCTDDLGESVELVDIDVGIVTSVPAGEELRVCLRRVGVSAREALRTL
ncbi:hypothetical protein AD006_29125 (plasmid) [Pseudonocardia sp. EC080610-09]|uniref:hypothetical protein n=1 Tax=unclassified Pseudonocardia TaxID=2619320 RepID=UPI000705C20A|nr:MULTISPECIES: hypothetical protein [unclassified Pseudonocardia]ALL79352.1 hypothetical protein AD006_29125 [Pseudonocardia sp. EC080610-09]ALL85324.1 hypothetical protein AD017_29515 [Pseudonocardia sp. EC080619-01]